MNIKNRQSQQGFNMIEILISIVVIAIGLLGIVALQAAVARFNSSAYHRNVATTLAMELSERLRTHGLSASEDAASTPTAATATLTAACRTNAGCSRAQMQNHDFASFYADVARLLPNGQAWVCEDNNQADDDVAPVSSLANPKCTESSAADAYTSKSIKIWWSDERDGGTPKRFTLVY